jgi:hypothetical protein
MVNVEVIMDMVIHVQQVIDKEHVLVIIMMMIIIIIDRTVDQNMLDDTVIHGKILRKLSKIICNFI